MKKSAPLRSRPYHDAERRPWWTLPWFIIGLLVGWVIAGWEIAGQP